MGTRKYMFDRDFGPRPAPPPMPVETVEVEEEIPVPSAPAPMFTEDDITLARESAFDEGRRQGQADAAEAAEARIAQALNGIAVAIGGLTQRQEEANDEAARNAVRVAYAALRKALPAACAAYAFEEAVQVVEEVIGHVLDEPRIIVRVSPDLAEPVRGSLEAIAQSHGFEGRVVVQGDGRLGAGDCRVEWADGGAERDVSRLLAEIDAAVDRALAPPEGRPGGFAAAAPVDDLADAGV